MDDTGDLNQVSAHDESWLSILRLNDSWNRVRDYRRGGLYDKWRWELDIIFVELARDIHRLGKYKNVKDFWNDPFVIQITEIDDNIKSNFRIFNKQQKYSILNEKDVYLRIIQDKVGKGSRYEQEAAF